MSTVGFAQNRFPVQITTPLATPMLVDSLDGEDQLSSLFELRVRLRAEAHDVDFSQIIGQSVTLQIDSSTGTASHWNGIVSRFRQGNTGPRFTHYSAEIVPRLWLLTQATNCRIFQNQSVPDIVTAVLTEHGVTDVQQQLTGTYNPREYCVQYRETDFAFVSRLLESEGIFYFFTHSSSAHTLVIADNPNAWVANAATLGIGLSASGRERSDSATAPELIQEVVPAQFKATDYNFTTPDTDLLSAASGDSTPLTIYEYPAGPQVKEEIEALVKIRLSEREVPAKMLDASSSNPALRAGASITLTDHPRTDVNTTWVLQSARHTADQSTYAVSFSAFPSDTAHRPPRRTPAPRIAGCQTAKVVGKDGEEIWTDEYGRIKVKFPWDLSPAADETASCWIRVAQSWAGLGWGSWILPRMGQEVVVSFLEGDPDRPLITGCVYNAVNTVPYTLPDEQTKTTLKSNSSPGGSGFNEIRLEDRAGSEEFFLQAQKEMVISVLGNQRQTIQMNRSLAVVGNESTTISGTQTLTVTGDVTRTFQGKITEKVNGDYIVEVGGDYSIKVSGGLTLKVTGDVTIQADGKITVKSAGDAALSSDAAVNIKSGAAMSIKAGASLSTEAQASITQKANATQTVEASGPLTLKGAIVQIN